MSEGMGRMPRLKRSLGKTPDGEQLSIGDYWKTSLGFLPRNAVRAWPLWTAGIALWLLSATAFYCVEHAHNAKVHTWGDAVYLTWMTMATVGGLDPHTPLGNVLSAADTLVGILGLGVAVWVVTESLNSGG